MIGRRESGNTILIVVIIIVSLVILGFLGWLFWNNFVNKPQSGATITNFAECKAATGSKILETFPEQCVTSDGRTFAGPTLMTDDQSAMQSYCTDAEKLCFEYPTGWTIDKRAADGGGEAGFKGDLLKVASPNGKMVLTFESGIGGIGGTCPEENQVSVNVLDATPAASLSGYKDEFNIDVPQVARVAYPRDGKFTAALYLTTSGDYAKKGTVQRCGLGFSQFIDGRNSVLSSDFTGAGAMTFGYGSLDGDNVPVYDTLDDAKSAFETSLYKEAASILASVHYQ